jgi:hypothetical protein
MYQIALNKPNGHKYTNIFRCKTPQNLPKLGFLVWKSGNPGRSEHARACFFLFKTVSCLIVFSYSFLSFPCLYYRARWNGWLRKISRLQEKEDNATSWLFRVSQSNFYLKSFYRADDGNLLELPREDKAATRYICYRFRPRALNYKRQ